VTHNGMASVNFMFVYISLGKATRYEPEMVQLSHYIIHKGTSSGPVHKYIYNMCSKLQK